MTIQAEIPREPGHVPFGIVEWEGRQWIIVEVDTANGVTLIERMAPDRKPEPPLLLKHERFATSGWLVACCAIFLFLALTASIGAKLTFGDVVGCIVGFVILVLIFRRGNQ